MKTKMILAIFIVNTLNVFCQQKIKGKIVDQYNKGLENTVIIANKQHLTTKTDKDGMFEIMMNIPQTISIRKLGYEYKNINVTNNDFITETLKIKTIKQIVVNQNKKEISKTIGSDNIGRAELDKLACCNLAESFENNNSVDVVFSDGVVGGKEIQMLGLSGVYSQQLWEGLPYHRGIMQKISLDMVPGPWIKQIGLNKGIGSVVNGYENITGQINIDFLTPKSTDKLFINAYLADNLKTDFNIGTGLKLSNNVYTNILFHNSFSNIQEDKNNDNFSDMPKSLNINLMNKWDIFFNNGYKVHLGLQGGINNIETGILEEKSTSNYSFNVNQESKEIQTMIKLGKSFNTELGNSLAFTLRNTFSSQKGNFDKKILDNNQTYSNLMLIYQSDAFNHDNKIKFGYNFIYDKLNENVGSLSNNKIEKVHGIFVENNYNTETFSSILGIRADYHNSFNTFLSPRLDLRFNPTKNISLKMNTGLGYRTPSILSESSNFLISNRKVTLPNELELEKAWNSGIVLKSNNILFSKYNNSIEVSGFLTIFDNQIIYDIETPTELKIYYLKNKSRALTLQIDNNIELNKYISLKLSYKHDNSYYNNEKEYQIPFLKKDKILANLFVKLFDEKINLSTTIMYNGSSRVPKLVTKKEQNSPTYFIMHQQINYLPSKNLDFYIGAENIFNYSQYDRIISYNDVNHSTFDAGMIWGPMEGRRVYIGVKYYLKK